MADNLYIFLSLFPITGATGINDFYAKRYTPGAFHLILSGISVFIPILYGLTNDAALGYASWLFAIPLVLLSYDIAVLEVFTSPKAKKKPAVLQKTNFLPLIITLSVWLIVFSVFRVFRETILLPKVTELYSTSFSLKLKAFLGIGSLIVAIGALVSTIKARNNSSVIFALCSAIFVVAAFSVMSGLLWAWTLLLL